MTFTKVHLILQEGNELSTRNFFRSVHRELIRIKVDVKSPLKADLEGLFPYLAALNKFYGRKETNSFKRHEGVSHF
jgi:hypothetical protein